MSNCPPNRGTRLINYFAAPLAANIERRSHKYPRRHRNANHSEKQPHRSARVLFQLNRGRNVFHPVAAVKHGRVVIASCEDTGVPSLRHVRQFPSRRQQQLSRRYCCPSRRRRSLNRVIVPDRSTLATFPPAGGRAQLNFHVDFVYRSFTSEHFYHTRPLSWFLARPCWIHSRDCGAPLTRLRGANV